MWCCFSHRKHAGQWKLKKLHFLLSVLLFSLIYSFHAGETRLSHSSFSVFYFSRPEAEAKVVSDSSLLPITYFKLIYYYKITQIYNIRKMRNITFLNRSHIVKKWEKTLTFFPLEFFQHFLIISEVCLGLYSVVYQWFTRETKGG